MSGMIQKPRPDRPSFGTPTKLSARALERVGAVLGSFAGGVKSGFAASSQRWEGGENDRMRSRPGRATESVDWGLNFGVRESQLSEARNLEQNFGIVRKINRSYANHIVSSCRMKWHTGDPAIDRIYEQAWLSWMNMCDRSGRLTFPKITKNVVVRAINDGRIFGQLDRRNGFLQLAMIESDRVSSDGIFNADRPDLFAGIGIDGNGRPKFAKVWDRTFYGQFQNPQEIPFEQLVQVYDSDRFDVYGAPSHYHAVLNAIRDLKEVTTSERLSAKKMSRWGIFWKTVSGGAGGPGVNLFGDNPESSRNDSPNGTVSPLGELADVYGLPSEDAKVMQSDRPSDGWFNLMNWLVREIAAGLDLPFGVVWNMAGLGGPAVRFEINQANRVFMAFLTNILEPMWFRPVVGAWITQEIAEGRLPFDANWFKFKTPRPKSITIDLGRDSKSGVAENIAGLSTASDWFADDDKDFEEQTERLAQEAAFRQAMCKKYGVALEEIRLTTPNGNPELQVVSNPKDA